MTHEYEEPTVGAEIDGRYRFKREIARGGMGLVFEAEHVVTHQRVAVKVLGRASVRQAYAQARLLREASVLGAIRHPNVVRVQDAGTCPAHGPYVAMELIEGRPLDGILLTRRILPVDQALAMVAQLCGAIAEVHQHGFIHRDLKPSNVLISSTPIGDQVELIDFGVAKILGHADAPEPEKLTTAGEMLGTREYMSPEQLMGKPIDERTDVYGAAAVLYECLVGDVPYAGPITAIITQMLSRVKPGAPSARRPEVPEELSVAVLRALEIEPADRFHDILSFRSACLAAVRGLPVLQLLDLATPEPSPEALAERREDSATISARPRGRQHTRAPYVAPARVVLPDGTHADGRIEDLSEGGVLFVTQRSLPQNQVLTLRMPLPANGRLLETPGVIRWVKVRRNVLAFGIELTALTEDAKTAFREYVTVMTRGRG